MADKKISQLTALSAANLAPSTDVLAIVDTSATETKKIVAQDLVNGVLNVASAVGIGTSSPAYKLDVNTGQIRANETSTGSGDGGLIAGTVGANGNAGVLFQTNGASRWNITTLGTNGASLRIYNYALASTVATFDSSGNLGLGVTPSAWSSGGNITLADNKTIGAAGQYLNLSANWYYSGGEKYVGNGYATLYYQQAGAHKWYIAPNNTSGAGATLAWTTAMTLDADGDLGVGTTSPSYRFQAVRSGDGITAGISGGTYGIRFDNGGTFSSSASTIHGVDSTLVGSYQQLNLNGSVLTFQTGATERARITSGGSFVFGVTEFANNKLCVEIRGETTGATDESIRCAVPSTSSTLQIGFYNSNGRVGSVSTDGSNTAFNTSSDRRLKENICLADEAGNVIDSIEVVKHDWKVGGHTRYGVIAQDLHKVAPEAVTPGDNGEKVERAWGVDYSKLVPMLVKEIQSLRARVAQLESK
jgi:hypothetical protein